MAIRKTRLTQSGSLEVKRGENVRRDNDTVKTLGIGLFDIDYAIKYYFDNIIQPSILENDKLVPVPIVYGSPERWKSAQEDGYYRDKNGQIMCPLIMYRRTNVEKNRDLSRNIDANNPNLFVSFEKKYTARNNYDNFSVLTNSKPLKEFHNIVVPDYIKLSYECMIWTDFLEQMNKIIEAINYAESSYWGELNRFKFYTTINSFSNTTEVSDTGERSVKSAFELNISGYIIPDTLQKQIREQSQKSYSIGTVKIGMGVSETIVDTTSFAAGQTNVSRTTSAGRTSSGGGGISVSTLTYLRTMKSLTADIITAPSNATFTGASMLQAPATLPATSKTDFEFFINGQYIPNTAVISFSVVSGGLEVVFDTTYLGYTLTSTDVVSGIGKFN